MKTKIVLIIAVLVAGVSETQAECPTYCTGMVDPICGSDGELYSSECDLERINCGKDVTKVAWSNCKPDCNSFCTLEYSPRCGSNGQVYGNKCTLLWASCGLSEPIKEVSMDKCKTK